MATTDSEKLPSYSDTTLTATCHCGGITVIAPALTDSLRPNVITECRCSVCGRYAALWAYYKPSDVFITAEAGHKSLKYVRSDKGSDGDPEYCFCSRCGCVTHCVIADQGHPARNIAVHVRMLDSKIWKSLGRRILQG